MKETSRNYIIVALLAFKAAIIINGLIVYLLFHSFMPKDFKESYIKHLEKEAETSGDEFVSNYQICDDNTLAAYLDCVPDEGEIV